MREAKYFPNVPEQAIWSSPLYHLRGSNRPFCKVAVWGMEWLFGSDAQLHFNIT